MTVTRLNAKHRRIAARLLLATAVCLFALHLLFLLTKNAAHASEQRYLMQSLQQVLPPDFQWDNDLLASRQTLPDHTGEIHNTVYIACQNGQVRYQLLQIDSEKGYNGRITLLLAIDVQQQRISRLRPLFHRETPGLGDAIEPENSDWLQQFALPLATPARAMELRQDGGQIDAIAGATITSRAVANAIQAQLFSRKLSFRTDCQPKHL
ncbi:MAG: electron transporter RnfG [Gammaproteobacteria bacterium]|nr:MAG: electron transporter RnfG [Gammaproteobacteria bacterium]